jgi:hypothetical protein
MNRAIVIVIAVLALAGCGSSKSSSAGSHNLASQYPKAFEASFRTSCTSSGGTTSQCGCALNHIEHAVAYKTVVKDASAIENGKPPSWYKNSVASCK